MYNLDMILKGKDAHKANIGELDIMNVECKTQQSMISWRSGKLTEGWANSVWVTEETAAFNIQVDLQVTDT